MADVKVAFLIYEHIEYTALGTLGCELWGPHVLDTWDLLCRFRPDVPEDGSTGFIAYDVPSKLDRLKIKTGRFLTRKLHLKGILRDLCLLEIKDNIDRSLFGECSTEIELVSGQNITQAYEDEIGGCSCMTGGCAEYTRLYQENPNKFRMLIMREYNNSARAIVHKLDNGDFYMDRVYSDSECLKERMVQYASEKGWHNRLSNAAGFTGATCDKGLLRVSGLDFTDGEIPYMDSLQGAEISNGLLNISAYGGTYTLDGTDGSLGSGETCSNCGERTDEDTVYHADDGNAYCESCYCELFAYCEECYNTVSADDIVKIEDTDQYVCQYCADDKYYKCIGCGGYFDKDVSETHDGDVLCIPCIEKNHTMCNECGEWFLTEDIADGYCVDCNPEEDFHSIPIACRIEDTNELPFTGGGI